MKTIVDIHITQTFRRKELPPERTLYIIISNYRFASKHHLHSQSHFEV